MNDGRHSTLSEGETEAKTVKAEKPDKPKRRRLGQVIPRGPNKYQIKIFRGYKPNGRNDYFTKTIHCKKSAEAESWLFKAIARRDRGEPLEDPDVTFEELYNEWLDSKKGKCKKRTIEAYEDQFDYYIKPKFGDARISSITSRDVQKWVNNLIKEDYSSATVRLAYDVFRGAIKYALDHEMLFKNPLRGIELPEEETREPNVLEPEEALKVLEACRTEPRGIFAAFLLWAGTRPNEAAALQWKDINWEKGSIKIRRNVARLDNGKTWEFADVKTKAGNRTFTLPASFMAWLKEHHAAQLEQRTRIGRDWYNYDLVFTNEVGEPLTRSAYRWIWTKVLSKAGIPEERQKMRPYDARHTMATLLLLERVPMKVVSVRMGHARTSITEDVYSHVLKQMQDQATDDLERAILGGKKDSGKKDSNES